MTPDQTRTLVDIVQAFGKRWTEHSRLSSDQYHSGACDAWDEASTMLAAFIADHNPHNQPDPIKAAKAEGWDEAADYDTARAIVRGYEDRGEHVPNPYREDA